MYYSCMTDEDIEEQLRLVEQDLQALIQDEGMTEVRLERFAPNIMKLFGVASAAVVRTIIRVAVLDASGDDKYALALMSALNCDPYKPGSKLTERREQACQRDDLPPTEATLRRWERRAMRPVARRIIDRSRKVASGEDWLKVDKPPVDPLEALRAEFRAEIRKLSDRLVLLNDEVAELKRANESQPVQD